MSLDASLLIQRFKSWKSVMGLSSLIVFSFDIYYTSVGFSEPQLQLFAVCFGYLLLLASIVFATKVKSFKSLCIVSIILLNMMIVRLFMISGGIESPISFVTTLIPILALLFGGVRVSAIFLVGNIITFAILKTYNLDLRPHVPSAAVWSGVLIFSTSAILFWVGQILESLRTNTVLKMERIQSQVQEKQRHVLEVENLKTRRALMISFHHEINNPLTTALMSTRLALRNSEKTSLTSEQIRSIEEVDEALRSIAGSMQSLNMPDPSDLKKEVS